MVSESELKAREAISRRAIGSSFSHLWSDALFARERARECAAREKSMPEQIAGLSKKDSPASEKVVGRYRAELAQAAWDRGSYVRWTVVTAYMAFERV